MITGKRQQICHHQYMHPFLVKLILTVLYRVQGVGKQDCILHQLGRVILFSIEIRQQMFENMPCQAARCRQVFQQTYHGR